MEPITSATTILTVVGMAVKVGQETYGLFRDARKAPHHVQRLATELESLYTLLATFQRLLDMNKDNYDHLIIDMLGNLETILYNCVEVFIDVKKTTTPYIGSNGDAAMGKVQGLIWAAFKRDDVTVLQQTLSSYKAMLNLSFTALSALYASRTNATVERIDENTTQAKDTLERLTSTDSRVDRRLEIIQKAVKRLEQQFDNKEREEQFRERTLQEQQEPASLKQDFSKHQNRLSVVSYNSSLRMSLRDLESIISSSPSLSRAQSMAVSEDHEPHTPKFYNRQNLPEDQTTTVPASDEVLEDVRNYRALMAESFANVDLSDDGRVGSRRHPSSILHRDDQNNQQRASNSDENGRVFGLDTDATTPLQRPKTVKKEFKRFDIKFLSSSASRKPPHLTPIKPNRASLISKFSPTTPDWTGINRPESPSPNSPKNYKEGSDNRSITSSKYPKWDKPGALASPRAAPLPPTSLGPISSLSAQQSPSPDRPLVDPTLSTSLSSRTETNDSSSGRDRYNESMALADLESQVDDWKGYRFNDFGDLILFDVLHITRSKSKHKYSVYLFEKILLCCKAISSTSSKSKLWEIPKVNASESAYVQPQRLQIKGGIYRRDIEHVAVRGHEGKLVLSILFMLEAGKDSLLMHFKSDADMLKWSRCFWDSSQRQTRAVEDNDETKIRSGYV